MAFDRLSQRFGVRGGFVNESEIRQIRKGPKMTSTSAAAWKTFKDELTQCFIFAHSYKKPELLEGRLMVKNLSEKSDDEKSERTSKPSAKSSGNPSFNVKKTSAQFDSNGRRNNDGKFRTAT